MEVDLFDTLLNNCQVNGRKKAVLSLPVEVVQGDGDGEQLQSELVRSAVVKGVLGEEEEVCRVILVPERLTANIVTR